MDVSQRSSFFGLVKSRELDGDTVSNRHCIWGMASDVVEGKVLAVEHNGQETPPLANAFCKMRRSSCILAVSDEDGFVSLFDTQRKISSSASHSESAEKAKICSWIAHQNAIFDVCWIKDDINIITASGDQTIKVWDVQEKRCVGILIGHTGSIKSVCSHPTSYDILVSGSRDGSFATWDLRCRISSRRRSSEKCGNSTAMVKGAHFSSRAKQTRGDKAASISITSVLYLTDGVSIATAGATNSTIKFWDSRNLKSQVTQACPPCSTSSEKETMLHGISSLSQDLNGVFIAASSMDNKIYLYNVLQLNKGPIQSFSRCRIESFYVKSAISPDASHILSGSSDGNAYLWQVSKPHVDPTILTSHDREVTAVAWCPNETGKFASCSDDFTVRTWSRNIHSSYSSTPLSSIRKRIMAIRKMEAAELATGKEQCALGNMDSQEDVHCCHPDSPEALTGGLPFCTPESHKKRRIGLISSAAETPETTIPEESPKQSPTSVFDPPSSLKRTIKDYFLAC